jgi:hypothetical protein
MPEHITAKATTNVMKWMPKALCGRGRRLRPWVLGDELEIAEGCHQGDAEGHQKRQPGDATDLFHQDRSSTQPFGTEQSVIRLPNRSN